MNFFKKNPTVEFLCRLPGVEEFMPIIPASEYRHPWVKRAVDDFKQKRAAPDFGMQKEANIVKCPGIFNLMRQGWILRTWQDITIETNGDGKSCSWASAVDQKILLGAEAVTFHPAEQLVDFLENWDGALRTILKFQTQWICKIPPGYLLLEIPVAFLDEDRFEVLAGCFSSDYGYAHMNPQIKWKVPSGKVLIKAGTPLAQYILVKKEKVDVVVRTETNTETNISRLIHEHTFDRNLKRFKELNQKLMG